MGSFTKSFKVLVLTITTLNVFAEKQTFQHDCADVTTEPNLTFKFGEKFQLKAEIVYKKVGVYNGNLFDRPIAAATNVPPFTVQHTSPLKNKYVCNFDEKEYTYMITYAPDSTSKFGFCGKGKVTVKCTKDGSGNGEPHFMTFTGDRYDYHGECDLVLLHNPSYKQGMGIDIHIRTKIERFYSYIKTAVVRIGNETFEVTGSPQNEHWLNAELGAQLPARIAGHPVGYRHISNDQRKFTIHLDDGGGQIHITTYKQLVSVKVINTTSDAFAGSEGLMGSYETGQKTARNRITIIEDPNEFGQEWQVLPTDPQLFREKEGPQYPMKCLLPTISAQQQRHLRAEEMGGGVLSLDQAHEACARVEPRDFDICVFDVLALNDVGVAGAY